MKYSVFYRRLVMLTGAFFATLSIGALLISPSTLAQTTGESITLSPVKKTYTVNPGQTLSDTLTVLNDGQTAYDFTVYATPYSVQDSSYAPNFTTDKPNADAYTWVQFEKTTYHAEPRQTVTVPYTLHVKDDASPGGHYGAIFVEIQPNDSEQQTGVVVHKRVGSLLYATVGGTAQLSGQNTSMSIPWYQSNPPLIGRTSVDNTGNTDFNAAVTLTVKNVFGSLKYANKQEFTVLPDTTRAIQVSWDNANWFGLYHATISSEVLGKTTTQSSYVLMMPLWLILLLIVCSIAGGVYAYFIQQKKHSKPASTKDNKASSKEA